MKDIIVVFCNDEPICAGEGRPLALKQMKIARRKHRRYQLNQGLDEDYYDDRFIWHTSKIPYYSQPKAKVATGISTKEV